MKEGFVVCLLINVDWRQSLFSFYAINQRFNQIMSLALPSDLNIMKLSNPVGD